MITARLALILITLILLPGAMPAARVKPDRGDNQRGGSDPSGPATDLSLIVGRPTDRTVTVNVLSRTDRQACIEYGPALGAQPQRTAERLILAGVPTDIEIGDLAPDMHYVYRLLSRKPGEAAPGSAAAGAFQTQRAPGRTFTFGVQGDSHPERAGKMFSAGLYERTMANVAGENLDFYVMMGDDFSIERLIAQHALSQPAVDAVYARQRSFLDPVARSAALFLVNGNHEQAARANLDGTAASPAVLAARARTRFFPLPAPDTFYGGNKEPVAQAGLLRDYYAWTWGDALFVVIDPYWHSSVTVDNEAGARAHAGEDQPAKGGKGGGREKGGGQGGRKRDLWGITLGDTQYQWLAQTLAGSKARWKLVFTHHVLGTGRGGIECAPYFEWGGQDRGGSATFREKRPGWPLPIHQLMAKTGVTIFFQGHDHLFARQELDGVVYQSCPIPADPTYTAFNREAYRSGVILPNSGHLRVTVSPDEVKVDYVSSVLPADEGDGRRNAGIAHSYTLPAKPAGGAK